MDPTCIAIKKTDGKMCGKKCAPSKLFCGTHNPDKPKKKVRSIDKVRKEALFALVASKIRYVETDEVRMEKTMVKMSKDVLREEMPHHVTRIVHAAVVKYRREGIDLKPLIKHQKVGFSRKIWMTLSWYLRSDPKTYESVAMSCKSLYHLFMKEKVMWYFHPLKSIIRSPRVIAYPIFRVVEFRIPDKLDTILTDNKLPKVSDVLNTFSFEQGKPATRFESQQRKGDVIIELCKMLVNQLLDPEEEFEEDIPGGGVFGDLEKQEDVKFEGLLNKFKVFKYHKCTYLVVAPIGKLHIAELEKTLNKTLCSYNGHSVVQLMRVDYILK